MKRYSQNDEQDVILEFFVSTVGKFLDIGAYDGISLSNTRALMETGWSGIVVEPNPFNLVNLINSVAWFGGKITTICAAVGPCATLCKLRIDTNRDRMWASTIVANSDSVLNELKTPVMVPVITASSLLEYGPFEFINIDAEWMDYDILRSLPRGSLDACQMLCIEPKNLIERDMMIETLRNQFGFHPFHETPENLIVTRLNLNPAL